MEQKLKDLLAEQGIALEPEHPPGKTVSTLIQRGWALLFGRKGTFLYPAHVERLGGLMVMPFEGLVAPDVYYTCTLNTSIANNVHNFTTARPRIHEIDTVVSLTASPHTLAGGGYLIVEDGDTLDSGIEIASSGGGSRTLWVLTASQYLSVVFVTAAAVEMRISVRSWNL